MKKKLMLVLLVLFLTFSVGAQVQQQQPKLEDLQKNLVLVEKTQAVPDRMKAGFEAITAKDSLAMLTYISSDLMEGRETGTRGYQLAAEYAASLFKLWGIKPAGDQPGFSGRPMMGGDQRPAAAPEKTYFQEFGLREVSDTASQITVEVRKGEYAKSRVFQSGVDFSYSASAAGSLIAPVVFAGYGITEKSINWDDFKGFDVKGKIVLILSEAPGKDDPKSPFQQKKELKDKYFPAAPAAGGPRGGGGSVKIQDISKLGPALILQVSNTGKDSDIFRSLSAVRRPSDDRPIINKPRRRLMIPGFTGQAPAGNSPVITISREMANVILEGTGQAIDDLKNKIETTKKSASMDTGARLTVATTAKTGLIRAMNVLGYIEGSDPKLKDEVVVIGAHYDHLGKWEDYVYNGADDNGSGSIGVLSAAKAMALNPQKPKRTVLFCLWTGEEQGLLGSSYYCKNPVYPLDKTVFYLNMDMISRPYDDKTFARTARMFNIPGGQDLMKKIKLPNFVTVDFTAANKLDELERNANQFVGLDLMLREASGQQRGGGGTDYSSFGAVKVPYAGLMTAMTDDYHQTSDSIEKVSGDLIEKVSRLAYITVFMAADK